MTHCRRLATTGGHNELALQPHAALVLMALFALLFWTMCRQTALIDFDAALAQSLRDQVSTGVLLMVVGRW